MRKPPSLLRSERGSPGKLAGPAPPLDMLFRPEEEHGASGKGDVIPPMMGRDGEVDDPFAAPQRALPNLEPQGLAAVSAGRGDDRVLPQGRRNAQRVPDADAPVGLGVRYDAEARRYGAEGIRRPDSPIVGGENQHLG